MWWRERERESGGEDRMGEESRGERREEKKREGWRRPWKKRGHEKIASSPRGEGTRERVNGANARRKREGETRRVEKETTKRPRDKEGQRKEKREMERERYEGRRRGGARARLLSTNGRETDGKKKEDGIRGRRGEIGHKKLEEKLR